MTVDGRAPTDWGPSKLPSDVTINTMGAKTRYEVWWHRRVVLVSEDPNWIAGTLDSLSAKTVLAEAVGWTEAVRLAGPIGAMVCHIDRPRLLADVILRAYEHWSTLAWQPCTLTWVAPRPGAARIRAALLHHGFQAISTPEFSLSRDDNASTWDVLKTRLDSAPWIVAHFAQRLGWNRNPRLIEILSAPVLRRDVSTVQAWARSVGLGYDELADVCHAHGACRPKQLLDVVRLSAELARVNANGCRATRDLLAKRLAYSSGNYLGRRVKKLSGRTLGDLMTMPLMDALDILASLTTPGSGESDPLSTNLARWRMERWGSG
jgi:hypothetical protein